MTGFEPREVRRARVLSAIRSWDCTTFATQLRGHGLHPIEMELARAVSDGDADAAIEVARRYARSAPAAAESGARSSVARLIEAVADLDASLPPADPRTVLPSWRETVRRLREAGYDAVQRKLDAVHVRVDPLNLVSEARLLQSRLASADVVLSGVRCEHLVGEVPGWIVLEGLSDASWPVEPVGVPVWLAGGALVRVDDPPGGRLPPPLVAGAQYLVVRRDGFVGFSTALSLAAVALERAGAVSVTLDGVLERFGQTARCCVVPAELVGPVWDRGSP